MAMSQNRLTTILSRSWRFVLLRGVVAILFGILTLFQPGISLASLVMLFGFYALSDGALGVWTAVCGRQDHEHWWVLLFGGLVGVGAGLLAFVAPGITALALLFYIAVWAICSGVLEIVSALRLRREIEGEWMLILSGAASVLFGYILMARPGAGAIAILWIIAVYAIFFGVLRVLLALKLRKFADSFEIR